MLEKQHFLILLWLRFILSIGFTLNQVFHVHKNKMNLKCSKRCCPPSVLSLFLWIFAILALHSHIAISSKFVDFVFFPTLFFLLDFHELAKQVP